MSLPKEETPFTPCDNCGKPRWKHDAEQTKNCKLGRSIKS